MLQRKKKRQFHVYMPSSSLICILFLRGISSKPHRLQPQKCLTSFWLLFHTVLMIVLLRHVGLMVFSFSFFFSFFFVDSQEHISTSKLFCPFFCSDNEISPKSLVLQFYFKTWFYFHPLSIRRGKKVVASKHHWPAGEDTVKKRLLNCVSFWC